MNYFLDTNNGIHALSDEDILNGGKSLLPQGCVEITQTQAQAILNPPPTLAQAQAQQCDIIDAAYAEAIQENVTFTTEGGVSKAFQADLDSQTLVVQVTQGYAIAGSTPSGFYWVSADNTQVPFTLADLQGLYKAMLTQGWAAFQKRQTLKAQINAATTVEAVKAVGWA